MEYTTIGQPTARIEGHEKVTGSLSYTADVVLPGTLWGRALRSPLPHARIVRIDASRASQVPGVHAVLTGADVRGIRYGRRLFDVPVLAEDRVRFVGERVAAVAAEDRDAAEEALARIEVVGWFLKASSMEKNAFCKSFLLSNRVFSTSLLTMDSSSW